MLMAAIIGLGEHFVFLSVVMKVNVGERERGRTVMEKEWDRPDEMIENRFDEMPCSLIGVMVQSTWDNGR